jgi:hypothetical protein
MAEEPSDPTRSEPPSFTPSGPAPAGPPPPGPTPHGRLPDGSARPDAMLSRPAAAQAPSRREADRPTFPRLRAFLWAAAMLSGGLVLVLAFFVVVGVTDMTVAGPVAAALAIPMVLFWIGTMVFFERSTRQGNTRLSDRERRGF